MLERHFLLMLALAFVLALPGRIGAQDAPASDVATIGVLAHRGTGDFDATWTPLRTYLDGAVEGWTFEFVPVTLVSARGELESGHLDFLITNPGHYVTLAREFPMSVLATRVRRGPDGTTTRSFGSVIFTAADSPVETLRDIEGRSVLAIDAAAFGGFQVAWAECAKQGVDLFRDPASLSFTGFPQDQIVLRVLAGEADVGIVRSGLLEAMAREGLVSLDEVKVLNPNASFGHPVRLSTRLYPEWPFIALGSTDPGLRNAVARALLATSAPHTVARYGMRDSWDAPVSYHAVRELLDEYEAAKTEPTENPALRLELAALAFVLAAGGLVVLRRSRSGAARHLPAEAAGEDDGALPEDYPALTRREAEILEQVCDGRSTKQIAHALGISPKTVEFHRSNLLRKFGAQSSLELVKLASERPT